MSDAKILKTPLNTETNRATLVKILVNDLTKKQLKEIASTQFMSTFKVSQEAFKKAYWKYYEETGGHCPFDLN